MRVRQIGISFAISAIFVFNSATASVPFQAVSMTNQLAPGTGQFFTGFSPPSLSSSGRVVFSATLTGASVIDEGIWSGLPGAIQLVARESLTAPGTGPGVVFSGGFVAPMVNSSGTVVFFGHLSGTGINSTNYKGIWAGPPGGLVLAARAGNPAPGAPPGVNYGIALAYPAINDAGRIAFMTNLAGTGVNGSNDFGIWTGLPGSLQLVAREGDTAPGMDGATFGPFYDQFLPDSLPVLGGAGDVVFRAYTSGGEGIWRWHGGTLELVARVGATAPGTSAPYEYFGEYPHINALGQVAFYANLVVGDGADPTNNAGVWVGVPGAVELVVRKGVGAPGAAGLNFGPQYSTVGNPSITDGGLVTVPGLLLDVDNAIAGRGIWTFSAPGGSLPASLVVRQDAPAPGLSGVTFQGVDVKGPQAGSSTPFQAYLAQEGVPGNTESLWVKDVGSEPVMIVRQGDLFDIGGGVFRTINYVHAYNGGGNWAPFYNPSRQMVIGLGFTNNTAGIFTANIPVPTMRGDMNCDGAVDGRDIADFALAVLDPAGYATHLPNCPILNGDANQDANTNTADIALFATCILSGGCP